MAPSSVDTREAARKISPELRERAEEFETERRLPDELSRRLAESGFYRMCVPERYGGLEQPPAITMETVELLARADAAPAWVVFIAATSGTTLALLPEKTAREVFAQPETMIAGVFAPRGEASVVEGGYRVSGQWPWGSGTRNADWILAGCRVTRDGETETLPNGTPRSRMMLVPASEVDFVDTWHVSGLSGTGSTDFTIRDRFVADEFAVGLGFEEVLDRPLYRFPQFGLLAMGIAAVSLGLARAAIEELISIAGGKTPAGSGRSLAARPASQTEVARAEATLRSARAFYYEAIESAWSEAQHGRLGRDARRDIRLATTHATQASAEAVDRMYHLGGGTSVYRRSPLQRFFRDVHVATQHMMVGPATWELTGRLFLGLETDTSQL
jgi:alkylation response protein AidB-like acyl-CoA dehydrogenase